MQQEGARHGIRLVFAGLLGLLGLALLARFSGAPPETAPTPDSPPDTDRRERETELSRSDFPEATPLEQRTALLESVRPPLPAKGPGNAIARSEGSLELHVEDHVDRPVACAVELRADGGEEVLRVVETGWGGPSVVERLPPGDYALRVRPDSLPEGVLPPIEQDEAPPWTCVDVRPGERAVLRLAVALGSRITGTVRGPEGRLQGGVFVDLSCPEQKIRLLVDASGRFEQVVHPRSWRVRTWAPVGHPLQDVPRPFPDHVDLEAGQAHDVELQYDFGTGTLRGRVLDQFGEPFAGLRVSCYPAKELFDVSVAATAVGEDGSFVLDRLPECSYRLRVYDDAPVLSPREGGLQEWVDAVEASLGPGAVVDVGTIHAVRAVRFHGRGIVKGRDGTPPKELTLHAVITGGRKQRNGRKDLVVEVRPGPDGTFRFALPYLHGGEARLVLSVGDEEKVYPFTLAVLPEEDARFFELAWP